MLRLETETGWWLVTHQDHAALAADFAEHWGNELFRAPEPRKNVLRAIRVHDDGWGERDSLPEVTREGRPAAFSRELVGRYSAFEEIDLADYLTVRERAVERLEREDAYAALLVGMHTENLLTERADRTTIAAGQMPLLDAFLERQRARRARLSAEVRENGAFCAAEVTERGIRDNFCLLQAADNMSLLSCVAYERPAELLHPMRRLDGSAGRVAVMLVGVREFQLSPWPLNVPGLELVLRARHVAGPSFQSAEDLRARLARAAVEELRVSLTAG